MKNLGFTHDGNEYYTAQIVDSCTGETYDQTVIFKCRKDDESPQLVDYYYGEPDLTATISYIDRWNAARSTIRDVLCDALDDCCGGPKYDAIQAALQALDL